MLRGKSTHSIWWILRQVGFTEFTMGNNGTQYQRSASSETNPPDLSNLAQYINRPTADTEVQGPISTMNQNILVDAAITSNSLKIMPISMNQVQLICQQLDQYEKVSLVYLIAKDYQIALSTMIKLLKNDKVFTEFLSEQIKDNNMIKKLIEALCVIQNYEVLKLLGYQKTALITDFSPLRYHCAIYISKVRKLCYRIMENLSPTEEKELMHALKDDLKEAGIPYCDYPYLELQLAYLFEKKYLQDGDLSNIIKHFKALELDQYVDLLQSSKINRPGVSYNQSQVGAVNTDKSTALMGTTSTTGATHLIPKTLQSSSGVYPMNVNKPGVVLIIENVYFYEEEAKKYKHLVIKTETALEKREGSDLDSKRLKNIFKQFGFDVIHKQNLTHLQMLAEIIHTCNNEVTIEHSSFILIMLSHGQLRCNSIPVNVTEIKKNLNSKVLEGKPKILILQACQGNDILAIQPSDTCTDAPRQMLSSQQPWQKHILELWSAVPGVVSFRSKSSGSWMIQTLCNVLESPMRIESFADICTEVNRLIGEQWVAYESDRMNVMLTNFISTLDKKFILPPLKPGY